MALAAALLTATAWGQGSSSGAADAVPGEQAECEVCVQVLRLDDGRVLRGPARATEDGWQVQNGGAWVTIPAEHVRSARREKDLLEQARRLERTSRRSDVRRRVAYGDWLLREGLLPEGLAALDAVLQDAPDQPDALELLRRTDLSLDLPALDAGADLGAFFGKAARFGPAAREIAVRQLAAVPEIPGLAERVGAELVDRDPRHRSLATLCLRRLFPGRELRPLLQRAVLDTSEDVRCGAALALHDADEPALVAPVLHALGSGSHQVRVNATEALGRMGYPAAVPALMAHLTGTLQSSDGPRAPHAYVFSGTQKAYIKDFDVEVAQNQAIADPIIDVLQEGAVLDGAVLGVTEYQLQTERAEARRSLAQLTGASPGHTTAAWRSWWDENGDQWRAGHLPPTPSASPLSPQR